MLNRRNFLTTVAGATALTFTNITFESGVVEAAKHKTEQSESDVRVSEAFSLRKQAALDEKNLPMPPFPVNGDETTVPGYIANFSKTLPHNALGEVDTNSYQELLTAIASNNPSDFEAIQLGGSAKLVNPQGGFCFGMEGADSHHLGVAAPPAFSSEEQAGEMVEDYWQALTRDVPYSRFSSDHSIAAAISDLSKFSKYANVNASTLFRAGFPGVETGPYISQFLHADIPYGAMTLKQQYNVQLPGSDHMTAYQDWLNQQNGLPPSTALTMDATPRYIRNGRDMADFLRSDYSFQSYLNAALILQSYGGAAISDSNPYKTFTKQTSFCTFGPPHALDLVARAANQALVACWYQKWSVHRRLRPEEFAGRVQNQLTGAANYPIHSKILNSQAVQQVFSQFGTYLLPQAYPVGCPAHPSYPAGHAAISGACATMLKALFKESFVIPNTVVATDDGLSLVPYTDQALTVGGELNKLAVNVSIGRDTAGVHWRTDGEEGLRLGEQVAISILRDYRNCFQETTTGFTLTTFDGQQITI